MENVSEVMFCSWHTTAQRLRYQYYVRYTIDGKKKVKSFYMSNKEPTQGQYFHAYFTACHFRQSLLNSSIVFEDYEGWKLRKVYDDSNTYVNWNQLP